MMSNFGYDNAKYTIKLSTMMKNSQLKPLLDKALSTYPIYIPKNAMTYSIIPTREELNNKLLNHYKYKEIGFETIGRFLDELEISMNEIMPYYYQLMKSQDIMNNIEDPFGNVDIKETFEQSSSGESTGNSSGRSSGTSESSGSSETKNTSETSSEMTNNDKTVNSKTPQGLLNIGTKDIDSVNHANDANWNEAISNSSGNSSDNGTTSESSSSSSSSESSGESTNRTSEQMQHTFTKKGNQGVNTYAHDMKEFREIFLNIEQMIINDERIAELFLNIW